MKKLELQAAEYAEQYPEDVRDVASRAWLDGRKSVKKNKKLDLYFVDDAYREIFEYWLNYKKERNQTYTQSGAESCYRKLLKLSKGNKNTMIEIIEQSCANNWAGLFELQNNEQHNQNRQQASNANASIFNFSEEVLQERERQSNVH